MDREHEEQTLLQVLDKLGEICAFHMESANQIDPNDILYTVAEVAKLLKINTSTVYKLLDSKQLPYIKIGAKKILKSSLMEFLVKNEGNDLTDPFNVKKIDD